MHTGTLIVGGGLAGLYLAEQLHASGEDFHLVEARDRLGGRIKSGDAIFDLGPAWFWHGQPRIAGLLQRLGLKHFDQYSQGDLMYEDPARGVQRGQGYTQGSLRVEGGLSTLINTLVDALPVTSLTRGAAVTALTFRGPDIQSSLSNGSTIGSDRVVLAIPPRLAAANILFSPSLPQHVTATMSAIPTWMAGQAKAVAVYDTPFWREAGLSGDAMSRIGPMIEIHDASPATGDTGALFGFIGVPPQGRTNTKLLEQHLRAQLGRLFGKQASEPVKLIVKDWASDPFTSTPEDSEPLSAHPPYGLPPALVNLWDGRLVFGGTEVARTFGGYLEGALEAAEAALMNLINELPSS